MSEVKTSHELSEQDLVELYDGCPGNASMRTFRTIAVYVVGEMNKAASNKLAEANEQAPLPLSISKD